MEREREIFAFADMQHVWCLPDGVDNDVYSHTDHAVEREILNPFLVWTQWSSTKRHGGVERRKTRADTEGEREY